MNRKIEAMNEVCDIDKLSECMRLQVLWVVVSGKGFLAHLVTVRCTTIYMLTKYVTRCEKMEAKFWRRLFDPQKKLILNNVSYSSCSWQPSNIRVLLAMNLSHRSCISLFRLYPFSSLTFCLFTQTAVYIYNTTLNRYAKNNKYYQKDHCGCIVRGTQRWWELNPRWRNHFFQSS